MQILRFAQNDRRVWFSFLWGRPQARGHWERHGWSFIP